MTDDYIAFEEIMNYPNPFSESTSFTFQHNQAEQYLDVEIMIFSMSGQLVTRIEETIFANGYNPEPIIWDGTDTGGARVSNGVYAYKIILKNEAGEMAEQSAKLIISRQ
jgi:flagellar hook assembly protein FlgD